MRLHAQLHVAADAFGDRRVAGRPGQQLWRARSQPDGPPLPLRRERRHRGAAGPQTSTAAGRPASTFRVSETSSATSASTCAASVIRAAPAARAGSARWPNLASARPSRMRLATPGQWQMGATAFGEMLPNHANRISLDAVKTDKWGLPVLAIDCATGENERLMRRDMMNDMAEMLEATGVKHVRVFDNGYFPGMGIHEMGTARMGRDPKSSVLNAHNQVWDCTNVFVTDGSCMTSAACQNPSLTYMAITARAAALAVDELKRGNCDERSRAARSFSTSPPCSGAPRSSAAIGCWRCRSTMRRWRGPWRRAPALFRRRRRAARRDRRDDPARDVDAGRQGREDRRVHGADGHRRLYRSGAAGVSRRHASGRRGVPAGERHGVHAGHSGTAAVRARSARSGAEAGDGSADSRAGQPRARADLVE